VFNHGALPSTKLLAVRESMKSYLGQVAILTTVSYEEAVKELCTIFYPGALKETDRYDEVPCYDCQIGGMDITLQGIPDDVEIYDIEGDPCYFLSVRGDFIDSSDQTEFEKGIPTESAMGKNGFINIDQYLLGVISERTKLVAEIDS
jgi:hypothetical protein